MTAGREAGKLAPSLGVVKFRGMMGASAQIRSAPRRLVGSILRAEHGGPFTQAPVPGFAPDEKSLALLAIQFAERGET